ncbi:MAG TPA: hypothetical protein P5123_07120 [Spirochaetota bacterium]|nr:hypothetical protein [Spirochaetota bacterium]
MIKKLAYSVGRKDEKPNIELAVELTENEDLKGIAEIVNGLNDSVEQIANDCIKVLYEIGERKPQLIAEYVDIFIQLLNSRNNRLVWGAMTALSKIAFLKPQRIFDNLEIIIKAYEKGSVITVDNSISVFAALAKAGPEFNKVVFPLLIKHLENCRPKEVAQHSERAFVCIDSKNKEDFIDVLNKRYDSLTDSQKKRIAKIIKRTKEERYLL